jgi:hypothetical protein
MVTLEFLPADRKLKPASGKKAYAFASFNGKDLKKWIQN